MIWTAEGDLLRRNCQTNLEAACFQQRSECAKSNLDSSLEEPNPIFGQSNTVTPRVAEEHFPIER
jgi:hypothetical protein